MRIWARVLGSIYVLFSLFGLIRTIAITRATNDGTIILSAWIAVALFVGTAWFMFAVAKRLEEQPQSPSRESTVERLRDSRSDS